MKNRQIRDHQISSSSQKNATVSASNARLDNLGAWMPSVNDVDKYLNVDFVYRTIVVSVTTQGFGDGWTSNYQLSYKDNDTVFQEYTEGEVKKVGYQRSHKYFSPTGC